ncbi:tRNA 2-selenouridine(34) synthase MnmH [Candidatus Woesearchaeota archaeon]|jgi:tRNA 2-selenouridine synthase|nr:tRNA 2-selenouridine(34) synthase MnmH [Candidatus Woesearchaeota archaeon]
MPETITIKEALALNNPIFVDVRSPKEFQQDHILNAINIPVLSDEERHIVGTIYKQVSQDQAIEKGMEYYEEKIPQIKEFVKNYKEKTIIVYCWRGGMRSKIIATLFESLGYKTYQLKGGYKTYRTLILEQLTNFKIKPKLFVLHGLTCTGKTNLLQKLPNAIDLEGLAQHRGSLYGAIGLKPRSQKMFDNLLLKKLEELNNQPFIFIEGESRRVGDLMLPESLWKAMKKGNNLLIERDLNIRIKEMVKEYFLNPKIVEEIKEISSKLWKVISKEKKAELLTNLNNNEFEKAAEILLINYYDPLYNHSLNKINYSSTIKNNDLDVCIKELLEKVSL